MSAEAASAAIPTNRNCTVQMTNSSSYFSLVNPQVHMSSGRTFSQPKPTVQPNRTEVCSFTKRYDTACGAVGVLTYDLVHARSGHCNERLALMFSVPYDYIWYSNWVAVGIFKNMCGCDETLYKHMYNDPDGTYFQRSNSNVAWNGQAVNVRATMSNSGTAIIKLVVSDNRGTIAREEKLEQQRREEQRMEEQRREEQRIEQQRRKRREEQRMEEQRREEQRIEQQRIEEQRMEEQRMEEQRREEQRIEQQRRKRREEQRRVGQRIEQQRRKRREEQRMEEQRREEQRIEQQRIEVQRREQQRREEQRMEEQRREEQRIEQQRIEEQRREQQRIEVEHREQQRREQQRREEQRIEEQRIEEQRRELQHIEEQRRELQHIEEQRRELQRIEEQRRELQHIEEQRRELQHIEEQRRELQHIEEQRRELQRIEEQHRELQRIEEQRRELQRIQEEERRRQERLERERRIQEEIDRENDISMKKLSQAHEKLNQRARLKGQDHHQGMHELQQLVDNNAVAIERDELEDVDQKFKTLLSKYQITEDENMQDYKLEDRMKTLQNELTIQYCRQRQLSIWSQFTFDHAVGYGELSLTERLNLLEAVLQLTLEGDLEEDLWSDKKYVFLFRLLEQLHIGNPTLARHLLLNNLDAISELSPLSREILSQILFSNIWTPTETMLFISRLSDMDDKQITSILHTVQTYRLGCLLTLSGLNKGNPLKYLQQHIEEEKDLDTILDEMRDSNHPENILTVMEDVLGYMEKQLSNYALDLHENQLEAVKSMIKSIDLANPVTGDLKQALIGISIAVQHSTTISTKNGDTEEIIPGYLPRLTQLASLLMLLLAQMTEDKGDKGCLLEIGTGEGKSCILAMFATIQAIRGTNVDIVTSSPVLARRDLEEWSKLYEMFGVTSSVVPPPLLNVSSPENGDNLHQDAYSKQIVYGTIGTFAADTLKQEFEKQTIRGGRKHELVIVDEVDYMTLDNGVQVTFLSHEASGLRHVEQVLASIWAMTSACQPIEMLETGEIQWATRIQDFHKATMTAVPISETDNFSALNILDPGFQLGFYSQEDIDMLRQAESKTVTEQMNATETIMTKLGVEEQYDLLSILERAMGDSVAIECYSAMNSKAKLYGEQKLPGDLTVKMLLLKGGKACELMSKKALIEATVCELNSRIKYSSQCTPNSMESKGFIVIPSFLEKYIETQLPVFVENALKAIEMTQDREYMVDTSSAAQRRSIDEAETHQYHAIIPVDFKASGVLEKNKRWGDGLQQFLEMKHQLAISQLSNITNYMSNFHYFKRYLSGKGIFGVSGTLGGDADKAFLARHYKTESYAIPAHCHKKVIELPVVQVSGGNNLWTQTLCETVWKVADRGQVVLVICEDVKTANELQKKMQGEKTHQHPVTMNTISERHSIEKNTFKGGNIIIATNLGGRGTDVKVDDEVNKCGGLFVLLTYFPGNRRVEKQVFGRTGRKGNPGMVQMILNHGHLALAYQGQSVEIMRQLREEYEVKRIHDMETNGLHEIEMKENLFSTFCEFLNDFDGNYTEQERSDFSRMKVDSVPDCFRSHHSKFDYQPALNALKESWALWLILHEEHINRHDDIHELKADLSKQLKNTGDMLLQGKSHNLYDHIKQAIGRTDLHWCNKTKCDYGAKAYWQSVASSDPFYRAVALYNQAYITINLAKGDYKAEARQLLKEAKDVVDVHLLESTNTLIYCNMSVTSHFEPHHDDGTNFKTQMDARLNIFKSWKEYIESALGKLAELESSGSDAITEDSFVYTLSQDNNYITTNELNALYEYGLGIVFEVKKKPKFCIDALICFFLGVIQVVAGCLVCALSCGSASQFGLGLISEGVSDMINGIEGMVTGSFDWASWAISKSISIGMSLLSAGFSTIKRSIKSVYDSTKGLLTGTKTLSSVAKDFIQSGKHVFQSIKGTVKSAASSVGKGTFVNMTKFTSSSAVKQNLKHASKYAVQELAKQGVTTAMNYAIDEGLKALFKTILERVFKNLVTSAIRENDDLAWALSKFLSSGVPKAALETESSDFKIDMKNEQQIRKSVCLMTEEVIPHLMTDCTTANKVIDRLTEVCNHATKLSQKLSGILKGAQICLEISKYSTLYFQMLESTPTKKVIDEKFVPMLLENIDKRQQEMGKYDQDGRHNLPDVKRLKGDLLRTIAESVSQAFIEACAGHMTSIMTKTFRKQINNATGSVVSNVLSRNKTQQFFLDQRHKHNMKRASHSTGESMSEADQKEIRHYIEDISNVDRPATALDIYVLTKSNLLQGKSIRFTVVDQHGKRLSEEFYPGTDSSAGEITLKLTKKPEKTEQAKGLSHLKEKICGKEHPYSGHFDIVRPDGTEIPVKSENQNCLYHAVAQATSNHPEDYVKKEAVRLRNGVKDEVQQNREKYTEIVKLQKGYDDMHKIPGKYAIIGGVKNTNDEAKQEYLDHIKDMGSKLERTDCDTIKIYNLGLVGKYKCLKAQRPSRTNAEGGTTHADHIPPQAAIKMAIKNLEMSDGLNKLNPKLYAFLESAKEDKGGRNLLTMEVLAEHHRLSLAYGSSHESKKCRELLNNTINSGDVEKMLKQSLIVANPLTSQQLRVDADCKNNLQTVDAGLSEHGTRYYYKKGYIQIVKEHCKLGLIDQNQQERLVSWVEQNQHHDKNTTEYKEILEAMKSQNCPSTTDRKRQRD